MSRDKQNIKTTDWLIRGIPKEQLEREKREAIKEAEAELRNKQIEEMAKEILKCSCVGTCLECEYATLAEDDCACVDVKIAEGLYNAGYRKASDVAEEIFAEIAKATGMWGCYFITSTKIGYLTSDVHRTLAELKKKYTESEDTE